MRGPLTLRRVLYTIPSLFAVATIGVIIYNYFFVFLPSLRDSPITQAILFIHSIPCVIIGNWCYFACLFSDPGYLSEQFHVTLP
jgi:hypothetical protein